MIVAQDELMPLGDVYAEALLASAAQAGQEEEVAAELLDLAGYIDRDPEFGVFLMGASVDDDARRESLEKMFRGRMNDILLNTLQVLNNRNRLALIKEIARAVELRMEARRHEQEVIVETAVPLDDDLRAAIRERMSRKLGKDPILIEQMRPELIGGIVIRVGDVQIDASVATRIEAMRRRLMERATQEIGGNAARLVEA